MTRHLKRLASILALAHLGLVLFIAAAILFGNEPDWPMGWLLFLFLDFPISMAWYALSAFEHVLPSHVRLVSASASPINDVWNFLVPLGFTSIVGTAWWYFIGGKIERWRAARPRQGSFWSRNLL